MTVVVSMHTPNHSSDPRRSGFIVNNFFSISLIRVSKMPCIWRQFRGLHKCIVTVLSTFTLPSIVLNSAV